MFILQYSKYMLLLFFFRVNPWEWRKPRKIESWTALELQLEAFWAPKVKEQISDLTPRSLTLGEFRWRVGRPQVEETSQPSSNSCRGKGKVEQPAN